MLVHVPDVLKPEEVAEFRRALDAADWADGLITAGYQSAKAKDNLQLPETLKQAIEAKQQAQQDAQRMEFVLLKERQEAERKRVEAAGIGSHV